MSEPSHRAAYQTAILDSYVTATYSHRTDLSDGGLNKNIQLHTRQFKPFLPSDKSAPVLDLGCGNGGFLHACRALGFSDLTGVDASVEQVAYCRERGLDDVVAADSLDFLQSTTRQFGVIAMIDSLEHVAKERVLETLAAARDRLRPGGRLIIRVPNMSNPLNIRTRYVDFTHEVGFSKESLQQVLRVTGLDIESVQGAFELHPKPLQRLVFDKLMWKAFQTICKRTLHLPNEVVRGKNLIAVATQPAT